MVVSKLLEYVKAKKQKSRKAEKQTNVVTDHASPSIRDIKSSNTLNHQTEPGSHVIVYKSTV